jgi:hypothetical protein
LSGVSLCEELFNNCIATTNNNAGSTSPYGALQVTSLHYY